MIRASAGAAAIAVPFSALNASGGVAAGNVEAFEGDDVELDMKGPVMFCVHDASKGEVSILHGTDEVVVQDRQLVKRIIHAAQSRRAV